MDRKKVFLLLISVFMMSLFSSFVSAQEDNFLNRIFEPFAGINIADTYERYWQFIDAFLYFLLFIGIVQFALSKQFEGRGGKAVIIAFGIALSIGITLWTSRNGFKLGERLGPIAGAIFAIIFFIFIVRIFKGDKEGFIGPAWWLAVGAAYIFVNMLVPEVFTFLEGNRWGAIGVAVFNLLFLIAIFYGIPSYLGKHFRGEEGVERGERRGWGGLWPKGEKAQKMEKEEEEEEEKKIKEEEKKAQQLLRKEENLLERLIGTNISSLKTDTQLRGFIQQLRNFVNHPQFLTRKMEITQKLEQVNQYITGRESADDKIVKILEKNKNLLGRIYKTQKGMSGYTQDELRNELKSHLSRKHAEVTAELLKEEGKEQRIAKIEAYLNKVVIRDEKKREKLLGDIKKKLQDAIKELGNAQPNLGNIDSNLDNVINKLNDLIKLDEDIQRREREMYREDKFLEIILSQEVDITRPRR